MKFLKTFSDSLPKRWLLLSCTRSYGYVHVEKKKPPHILGPGWLWRKCNVVHPHTKAVDPFTKYQWLTKSVSIQGLPDKIQNIQIPNESITDDVIKRAEEYLVFQDHNRPNYRIPELKISGLIQSTLASVWPLANEYAHLRESHLTFEPTVECYWRRDGHNFICQNTPLHILHTAHGLDLFCEPDAQLGAIPPIKFLPSSLGVFKRSFDQITPFGGCRRHGPFPMAHTLFTTYRSCVNNEQLLAHGLIQLFAQAAGEGVHKGFKLDQPVPFPLVNQGIVTDGQYFTFVAFQLNTLDFRQDSSDTRHNVFWAGPTMRLYDNVIPGDKLEGVNKSCASLIVRFLLNRPEEMRKIRNWAEPYDKAKPWNRPMDRIPGN